MPILLAPTLKLNGSALSDEHFKNVVHLRVSRALNSAGEASVSLVTTDWATSLCALGDSFEVADADGNALFSGEVVNVVVDRGDGIEPSTTIVAYEKIHRLAVNARTKTWMNGTLSDAINDIARECDLRADVSSDLSVSVPYLLQAASHLEMVDILTARVGADWWCHDGGTLKVRKLTGSGEGAIEVDANNLRSLSARMSSHHPTKVEVRGWDSLQQQAIVEMAEFSPASHGSASGTMANEALRAVFAQEHLTSTAPVVDQEQAKRAANGLLIQNASGAVRIDATSFDVLPSLDLGKAARITNAGSIDGTYLITRVNHMWTLEEGFTSSFVCGERRPGGLLGGGGSGSGAGAAAAPVDRHAGLVVGEVTNINDPEQMGRVKLRFVGLDGDQESNWARVLIPGAGADRGSVTLPEVGDEVLVGFEADDVHRPVVLGGLFGKSSTIPIWQVADGKVTHRRTTSRLGHYLEFGDGEGDTDKHIKFALAKEKNYLRLGADKSEIKVEANKELTIAVGSNSKIVFDGSGNIAIDCVGFKLNAKQDVAIAGQKIANDAKLQFMGKASSIELKGNAMAKLEAGGALTLKGAVVKIN